MLLTEHMLRWVYSDKHNLAAELSQSRRQLLLASTHSFATSHSATLSMFAQIVASAGGVDGVEVPRSGREAYIALHRCYKLTSQPLLRN